MTTGPAGAFDDPRVVSTYEDWYATPFGRLADRIERRLLREALAPLAPGARVLEVGCGSAHFARALADWGYRVCGVEPARGMLAAARGRVPLVQARAEQLPFADGAFDGAFLVAVLDFVDDPVAVLREARRVARQRVAVLALCRGSWLALRRRLAARRGHPIFRQARFWSRTELLGMALSSGARPDFVRGGLVLPPSWAAWTGGLEERWSRGTPPGAGILALGLPGGRPGPRPPEH